jgi:hypothetical protein
VRARRRREDTVKIDLNERGYEGMDWIQLAQDRMKWLILANTVIKLLLPYKAEIFLTNLTVNF